MALRLAMALLLLLTTLWATSADTTRFFVRNREVSGQVLGGEVAVPYQSLKEYLIGEEMERLELGDSKVTVDRKVEVGLTDEGKVPLTQLVKALGFTVRVGRDTGWVDMVPPSRVAEEWVDLDQNDEPEGEQRRASYSEKRREYRIAGMRMKEINKTFPLSDDPGYAARVEKIGRRIAQVSPLRELDWKFTVVETSLPNAACSGEGHVFVTTGLLELGLTDDELAGVLGHEVAHGVRRHPFKRFDLMQEQQRLLRAYLSYVEKRKELDDNRDAAGILTLQNLIREIETKAKSLDYRLKNLTEYTRKDEEEADVLGARYARAAGYSDAGLGNALEKLERANVERFGTALLNVDLSHPPLKRRLEVLRKVRSRWTR